MMLRYEDGFGKGMGREVQPILVQPSHARFVLLEHRDSETEDPVLHERTFQQFGMILPELTRTRLERLLHPH